MTVTTRLLQKYSRCHAIRSFKPHASLHIQSSDIPGLCEEREKRMYSSMTLHHQRVGTNLRQCQSCGYPTTVLRRTYLSDCIMFCSEVGFYCFDYVHTKTGSPWWLSIGLKLLKPITTTVIRDKSIRLKPVLLTIPVRSSLQFIREYYVRKNYVGLTKAQKEIEEIIPIVAMRIQNLGVQSKIENKKDLEEFNKRLFKRASKKQMQKAMQRHKAHPLKPLVFTGLHFPLWMSFTLSLREMSGFKLGWIMSFIGEFRSHIVQEGLKTSGLLWFKDLTVPDPLFILPVMTFISMLVSIELQMTDMHRQSTVKLPKEKNPIIRKAMAQADATPSSQNKMRMQKYVLPNFLRLTTLLVLSCGSVLPASVTFYWWLSTVTATGTTLAILSPNVKKKLRMASLPTDSTTPYKDLYCLMKVRYNPVNWYKSAVPVLARMKDWLKKKLKTEKN